VRGLVQRVVRAHVDVAVEVGGGEGDDVADGVDADVIDGVHVDRGWERAGEIGPGLCVLVGVTHDDAVASADQLAEKVWHLRVLDDDEGVMNVSLAARHEAGASAQVLVVSQFTLYGNTDKGRRPSWIDAARPEQAEPLVERVVERLGELGATVQTGRFRTEMRVEIVNDGPVTLMLEL
jgi:D-tyrosyl-tRNA(Tyr) deacylase